jgi:ATP-binding cassette subfamily C protein
MLPALADGWAVEVNDLEALMVRVERITRIGDGIQTAIQAFARGGVILLSALLAETSIQLGGLLVYSLLIIAIVARPFSHMADFFHQLGEVRMAWARLRNLANQPRRRGQAERGYSAPVGRLVVEQLTVLLPGMVRPLLRDVNLVVGPGDVVGIAGNVGSGKSTLLRAVMGMIRPTAGACFLDGHATWQWDRVDIARHVGFLPQDPGLSDGTVAEAIARLDVPNMAMVIEAATRAGAHQTIVALPQGYATPLSETMLSAGQRQRIALARAIYGRPRLVVLDEPSSWLDDAGMAQLIRLFAILKADGCGVLFSSHNLDLVDAADHVLAMRAGVLGTRRAPAALAGPQGSSQGAKPA